MLDLTDKTLLVVAPHPDDEVLSCGGLIGRIKAEGGRVYVLYLTAGATQDFSEGGSSTLGVREKEIEAVAAFLDIDGWRMAFAGDTYHLQLDRVPQRQLIHEIERGEDISLEVLRPDVLVFSSFADYNQDHRAAAAAAFAACRPAPQADKHVPALILSGEAPMEGWSFPYGKMQPNVYVGLSELDIEKKIRAMELYASQLRGKGHPRHLDVLRAFAQVRGSIIGAAYAEAFVVHKLALP